MAEEEKTTEEAPAEIAKGKQIGKITHYFGKIGVGVLELEGKLKVGDTIVISGHSKEFEQAVDSMQVEHEQVTEAKKGDAVGLKTEQPVKEGDSVFLKG
jgi:putative protease